HNREPPTFENTLIDLERAGQLLRRVDATFGRLNACNTNPKLQDIDTEMAPKLTAQEDAIHLNPALWTRVEALYNKRARAHLDSESQQLLTRYHTEFVRAGARLEPADQTRLRALNTEISTLTTRFKHNVLKATAVGAVVVDDVRDLDGLSEGQIGAAAQAAAARGLGGKWVIALQNTTNQPLLAQLKNRALRQRIYEASIGRARGGSSDNTAVIAQLVKLRAERAALLGYPNHAAYQLEDESAGNPAAVRDMISQVAPSALAGAPLALFLADYFARDNKQGGAWMASYVNQSQLLHHKPVVANHLNIPKPQPGQPVLLTFDEVTTMFHEFGHALHGMLSSVRYPK